MNQIMPLIGDDVLFDLHEEEYHVRTTREMDFALIEMLVNVKKYVKNMA